MIKAFQWGPRAVVVKYKMIQTSQRVAHEQKTIIGRNLTGSPLLSLGNLILVPFFSRLQSDFKARVAA